MQEDPIYLLNPVFDFLDQVIADYGLEMYLVAVNLSPFVIAWILSGGFWRRRAGPHRSPNHRAIAKGPPAIPPILQMVSRGHPETASPPDADDLLWFAT